MKDLVLRVALAAAARARGWARSWIIREPEPSPAVAEEIAAWERAHPGAVAILRVIVVPERTEA